MSRLSTLRFCDIHSSFSKGLLTVSDGVDSRPQDAFLASFGDRNLEVAFVNLTQTRDLWDDGTRVEEMPSSHWPVAMTVEENQTPFEQCHPWVLDGIGKVPEPKPVSSVPLRLLLQFLLRALASLNHGLLQGAVS